MSDLCCIRQNRCLFEGLSFIVKIGQIWHITGSNGAGKTSLLKILAGLNAPNQGDVSYSPLDIEHIVSPILFVGHNSGVELTLSPIENLRYWCDLQGLTPTDDELYQALTDLGLLGLEDDPANYLSEGQKRRIALARLVLSQARLWILDEPFTALDIGGVERLQQRFKRHVDLGGSIVLTSHQPLVADLPLQHLSLN